MTDYEATSFISKAREFTNQASFDIQQLREDSIERQALHNPLSAVEALIQVVDRSDGE
jgi:hypothetical protein